jgi:hypothetical protein
MRRVASIVILGSAILLAATSVAYAAVPEKVVDEPDVNESYAAASPDYFAWTQNPSSRPGRSNTYVRPSAGGPRTRVNPKGTHSFGVGIDGSMVVYQSVRHGNGNIRFYDAASQARPAVPDAVNTRRWEDRPTISGDWLLFTRDTARRAKAILYNVATDEQRVLRSSPQRRTYLVTDQVNGDWATFEWCHWNRHTGQYSDCNVFRYQISTGDLVKVENPGRQQYAGAVSQDGTIYMVRTGGPDIWRCGRNTQLVRYPVGGPGVIIADIQTDALTTFATDETDGSTTMYLEKARCDTGKMGVYRITDADTAT